MGYAMKKSDDGMDGARRGLKPANTKTTLALKAITAQAAPEPWAAATDAKRRVADARLAVLGVAVNWVRDGVAVNLAAETLFEQMHNHMTAVQRMAVQTLDGRGKTPSKPTLIRWLGAHKKHGKAGLLPAHTGRQRIDYGWEARAVELFNKPSKPNAADVAFRLITEGFADVKHGRVKAYLDTLPATFGKHSPARVGKHLHELTKMNYTERHMDDLVVGDIYAADGHTCDCYVAHPETGGLHRPELTVFLDLKSRYPVGWWISESESTTTTLFALSNALTTHNHVPNFVYVDKGSGYVAKLMTDEVVGFYAKFAIEPIFALPGNPHGKGWIERFFKTIRDRHDKFFDDGLTYCGDDMAPEINRRLHVDIKNGKRKLRSLAEYVDSLKAFFAQYIETPMPKALSGSTPAEVFKGLQRVEIGTPMAAVARPSVMRTAYRQSVTLDKRRYFATELASFDTKTVRVEYDMHADAHVWISDAEGRFICMATITERIGVVSTSRLEDQKVKRLDGQIKRLEKHADEKRARLGNVIDMDAVADRLEMVQPTDLLEAQHMQRAPTKAKPHKPVTMVIDIDVD